MIDDKEGVIGDISAPWEDPPDGNHSSKKSQSYDARRPLHACCCTILSVTVSLCP